MKKKIIRIVALMLSLVLLLGACGGKSDEPVELDVPTFEDKESMVIGIWSGSMNNWTDDQFAYLQDACINMLVGSSEYIHYTSEFFDKAEAAGVSVIPDSRNWLGQVPDYADHPAFYGYCVWDEPASSDFEAIAEKKAKWDSVMGEKTFFVNIFPGWAGSALGGSFKSYVSGYIETVKPEILCFDHYALMEDSSGNTVVRDSFFSDMDICSHYAKEAGIDFWFTLLSAGHLSYVTPTTEEFSWQMAVGQAYGATGLIHYVYASHDPDYTAPIDWNTQKPTEVYGSMVNANAEVASWDHIYMSYDWQGTATVGGSNNAALSTCFQLCQFAVDPTQNTGITAIESGEDLLCGIFKDDSGNMAYMLTNATNPSDEKNTTVKLTLDETYKGVLVIDGYEQTTVKLKENTATIEIESGEGVFVIPLKAK